MNHPIDIRQSIDTISQVYVELTDACKTDLEACTQLLTVPRETRLVREGQFADKTYFIVQGCARAFYLKNGRDITDWFAFENDFISSINSFFLGVPSPHFIEVLEEATLLEISREHTLILSDAYPDFARLGMTIVTKTLLQLQQRIVSLQFESASQKYDNLLTVRPDITQRVPLTHIASYLGISLETLSRIRHPRHRI